MKKRFFLGLMAGVLITSDAFASGSPTTDVSMNIQSLLDQLSQIRTTLEQAASASARDALKEFQGDFPKTPKGYLSRVNPAAKTFKTAFKDAMLPEDMKKKGTDNVDQLQEAVQEKVDLPADATTAEITQKAVDNRRYEYMMYATGYGRTLVTRLMLDEHLKAVAKLMEEGENAQTEVELIQKLNDLQILEVAQLQIASLLDSIKSQPESFAALQQLSNKTVDPAAEAKKGKE